MALPRYVARAGQILNAIFMLPCLFVFFAAIPWELVLVVFLCSFWSYDRGWQHLGGILKVAWIVLGIVSTMLTVATIMMWLSLLRQAIRGDTQPTDES